jgi:hypothetical protein
MKGIIPFRIEKNSFFKLRKLIDGLTMENKRWKRYRLGFEKFDFSVNEALSYFQV